MRKSPDPEALPYAELYGKTTEGREAVKSDLIMIGAGGGGCVAVIRAVQIGMKVAIAETDRADTGCPSHVPGGYVHER